MIIQYNTISLEIQNAIAGSDAATISYLNSISIPDDSVQTIADDSDILDNPTQLLSFIAVVSGPTLLSVARKNFVTLSTSTPTIVPADIATIDLQLKQSDGVTDLNEIHTIAISTSNGFLSDNVVTTNASGFISFTYRAGRFNTTTIYGSAQGFFTGTIGLVIENPTTASDQNWIETGDIKAKAVTAEKIAASIVDANLISQTYPSAWWTIKKAVLEDVKDVALTDSVNNIVSDGIDHIYMNGLDTAVPKIKKVNRRTFTVDGSLTYTNNNLANRTDGMAFDGKFLWVASSGDLLRVDPVTMTLDATITIDSSGGDIHALAWDGEFIYAFVRGGTTYANKLLEITRNGTVRSETTILSANDVKQIAVRQSTQGLAASGDQRQVLVPIAHPAGSSNLAPVIVSGLSLISVNFSALFGITATANGTAASDGINYWVGVTPSGGSKESLLRINTDTLVSPTLLSSMEQGEIGIVYDLFYDGAYMWAITSEAGDPPASTDRRFVRKLQQVGTDPIKLIQTIDMGPDVDPNALCVENDRVFVGNFAAIT
jgi:hypothetical protein